MARKFKIFRKTITQDSNCFFVAEIGANHCGNVETAKKTYRYVQISRGKCCKISKKI